MPVTKTQLERRNKQIGSSDMAAILGLDRHRNAYDVWLDKTGRLEEQNGNQAMYAGTMFEDGILNHAETVLGKLVRNQYRSAKSRDLPIGANIDALLVGSGVPIEVKTAGLYGPLVDTWGEQGTDEVPDRVIIQCQVHMICTAQELCHVATFLGGRGFQMFAVPRDNEIVSIIEDQATNFWTNNVLADVAPTNLLPHPAIVKRVKREPATIVTIDQKLVDDWQAAKERAKAAKDAADMAQTAILAAMGDAEAGQTEAGMFTFFEQTRAEHTVKASKFRVARFKVSK